MSAAIVSACRSGNARYTVGLPTPARSATASIVTAPGPPSSSSSRAARNIARRASSLRGRPRGLGAVWPVGGGLTALAIYVTHRNLNPKEAIVMDKPRSDERKGALSPYPIVKGAARAIDFYRAAFG